MLTPEGRDRPDRQVRDRPTTTVSPRSQADRSIRLELPDRHVTADTIEEAYIRFIFCCNPALPPDQDTEALREAFRNPPRSGGKVFDAFTIYELVQRFYNKDIKTWTELTITLGVEPPDPSKDESAQKVAQYGVRLKKWMNSMHVKAFFEYLMNIPNDYWTMIPTDPDPTASAVRDGVAIEDDMALRALLPHIRPKRGRKRPEGDDAATFPAQRQRLSPPTAVVTDGFRPRQTEPWSAHPDVRNGTPLDSSKPPHSGTWGVAGDHVQTPVGRWPQSAATPTARGSFWDDALEPHSAVAPSKGKSSTQRRGAKNVSSAWKTAGQDSGARPRGRPPINRTPVDGPGNGHNSLQNWSSPQQTHSGGSQLPQLPLPKRNGHQQHHDHHEHQNHQSPNGHGAGTELPPYKQLDQHLPEEGGRPSRPSISLQVPERPGSSVRLATPTAPPVSPPMQSHLPHSHVNGTKANGQETFDGDEKYADGWRKLAKEATDSYRPGHPSADSKDNVFDNNGTELPDYYFDNMADRTNMDALIAYFIRSMSEAEWRDTNGNRIKSVRLEESAAMVHAMLQSMYKNATSAQAFLINLAALAGSTTLVTTRPRCTRLSEDNDQFTYKCEWEYQFGQVKGGFTFEQVVPASMWSRTKAKPASTPGDDAAAAANDDDVDQSKKQPDEMFSKEYWQKKYQALTAEMEQRDKDLNDLKDKLMAAMGRTFQ